MMVDQCFPQFVYILYNVQVLLHIPDLILKLCVFIGAILLKSGPMVLVLTRWTERYKKNEYGFLIICRYMYLNLGKIRG